MERQHVIAAETTITEQGQQQGARQSRQGLGPDGQTNIVPVPCLGQVIQHGQCGAEQQQAAQGAEPFKQMTPHAMFLWSLTVSRKGGAGSWIRFGRGRRSSGKFREEMEREASASLCVIQ